MSIIDSLLPSFAFDIVAVYTQDLVQVFKEARAIKANIKEMAKVMEHPVETGAVITDHRIILPIEIELAMIIQADDYQSVYKNIRQYFLNSTLLLVQTKTGIYDNQLISSMPHEEDPDQYDTIKIALSLKQAQFVTSKFTARPKNPRNTSTANRGVQQPQEPSDAHKSFAADQFDKARGR